MRYIPALTNILKRYHFSSKAPILKRYHFDFTQPCAAKVALVVSLSVTLTGLGIPGLCSTDDSARAARERADRLRSGSKRWNNLYIQHSQSGGGVSISPQGFPPPPHPTALVPLQSFGLGWTPGFQAGTPPGCTLAPPSYTLAPAPTTYTSQSGITSYSWGTGGTCSASGRTMSAAQWQSGNQWGSGNSTPSWHPTFSSGWSGPYINFQPRSSWNSSTPSGQAYSRYLGWRNTNSERTRYRMTPALPNGAGELKKVTTWEAPDATDKQFKQQIQQSEIDNGPDDNATVALILNAARYYVDNRQWDKADKMVKRLEKMKVENPEISSLRNAIATGSQPIAPTTSKYQILSPVGAPASVGWKPVTLQQPTDFRSLFPHSR